MSSDIIVIGLGAMGSAACYQLAKRRANVIGIDRFSPPHTFGSTHGETRVTRQAIGEGEHFVPLALRSYEIWRELEAETGEDLLTITGGLIMSGAQGENVLHGSSNFVETTINTARKFKIDHRILDTNEIAAEFPQFNLQGNEIGYFEHEAGFLRPEACVKTQLELAQKLGATLRLNEKVIQVESKGDSVEVVTDKGKYSAAKVIISAGPWVNEFFKKSLLNTFKIYRQVLYWFDVSKEYEQYKLGHFPIFIWEFGRWKDDFVYGFPAIDGSEGGLKVATETYEGTTLPDETNRVVSEEESATVYDKYIDGKLKGIGSKCMKAATCLYTMTPDSNFVIDHLDGNILLASPCSGHGFKHSAAIGETLAELVIEGKSRIDISPFSLNRFK